MTRQTITVREVSSIYDNSIQTILYSCALNKDYNSNSDIKLSLTSLSLNNKYLELEVLLFYLLLYLSSVMVPASSLCYITLWELGCMIDDDDKN